MEQSPFTAGAPSMLVLGRDPVDVRASCQCLRELGIHPRVAKSSATLVRHVEPGILGIVVVEERPDQAARVCACIRRWAHESIFPIVALTAWPAGPELWRVATTVIRWPHDVTDFIGIAAHLREHARALPSSEDVALAWELRSRLRASSGASHPKTLDALACGEGVLLSGLLTEPSAREDMTRIATSVAPERAICSAGLRASP